MEFPLPSLSSGGPRPVDGLIGVSLADRFRIDRLIGVGGMAVVYEATDLALGRTVAVKLFRLDTTDDAGSERQSGEVAVLASLNHFALVTLFDAGTAVVDGTARTFIVMELVDGTDLRTRIAAGPMPRSEVATLGADLAEALHYVHERGIIHRDIKPANVLLAASGFPGRASHAKLADFGIARLVDATRLTATGTFLGTAGYLSPEQALGTTIGAPSDVYSLGLVLLECLTGERAYPGTAIESAMARLQRDPEISPTFGRAWADVLGGMTRREPDERLRPADAAVRLRLLAQSEAAAETIAGTTEATVSPDAGATTEAYTPASVLPAADAPTQALDPTAAYAATRAFAPADTPTRVLPGESTVFASAGFTAETVSFGAGEPRQAAGAPAASARPPRSTAWPRVLTGRTGLAVLAVAAVALITIVVLGFTLRPAAQADAPAGPSTSTTAYPDVAGTLGDHLRQLQESVAP
ncbi:MULTISPECIES: serine/threonine-protein kinase [Cryobacterium]|uniref:Serine/threonine protein kinase n=2 Tax=Bacteria TaxID=2 RepID=A0ABY2INJ8_9MICO|nr:MULTISPECIES: serine/threonine-protein kinase [Cryobacterium]MDY7528565.1 serine/threonine-protein kinase [Cryobacterium sp. 10C2]MDY7555699.1 serine/threonine-protein kinase [Cryobacterium sp. 10C3]MEB0002855.1 serine/threonine-protein kinase [Cryobacterium sp. RTC2.1]MEB0291117.1 serine/threonine-protein kinase [Cryobacterium sp. 10C2]TFB99162.1 serine/threonine protein kinase [Cryobacterium sp. MDB2-A-1]